MTNMSGGGMPPSFGIARAAAMAHIQEVGVRIIQLPDGLHNNASPLKLPAIVIGQTPDGLTQLQTERGIITMLMKDRGTLPQGQRLEIDIPAGNPPQQATVKSAVPAPVETKPVLNQPVRSENNLLLTSPNLTTQVKIPLKMPSDMSVQDMAEVLTNIKETTAVIPSAPLQAGQAVRLIPLPAHMQGQIESFDAQTVLNQMLNLLQQPAETQTELQNAIIQKLLTLNISSLTSRSHTNAGVMPQMQSSEQVLKTLANMIDKPQASQTQTVALENLPIPVSISPSRPLDVKIIVFPTGNFSTLVSGPNANLPNGAMPYSLTDFQVAPTQQSAQPAPSVTTSQPAQPLPVSTPPLTLLGQVSGFTAEGQPIVTFALPNPIANPAANNPVTGQMQNPQTQSYVAQFPANNIVTGAPILIDIVTETVRLPMANLQSASFVPFAIGGQTSLTEWVRPAMWDNLQDLLQTVSHFNPALGAMIPQILPNAANPQNIPPLAMLFLTMMRTGDMDALMPTPILNLLRENGKIDILRSLSGDAAANARLENTALPGDWRATMLPFYHQQQISRLPLYYKKMQDDENDAQKRREQRMRFLFNLQLSRMGDVQIDGFVQPQRLDMILRTKAAVSVPMQRALQQSYTKAIDRSNLVGELSFQFKPEQWVSIEMPLEIA